MLVNPFQLSNMMPDYSRMIGIPINVTGTAPSDGYISIVGRGAAGGEKQLTEAVGLRINDVPVFTWGGQHQNSTDSNGAMFPIAKGQKYQTSSPAVGSITAFWINFIPCKGA